MSSASSSALSDLSAFATQIAVVAHNTANFHTPGFEKSRAVLHSTHPGGVEAHIDTIPTTDPIVLAPLPESTRLVEPSNVDLADEMTTLRLAFRAYQANLGVLQAEHERVGYLLDISG